MSCEKWSQRDACRSSQRPPVPEATLGHDCCWHPTPSHGGHQSKAQLPSGLSCLLAATGYKKPKAARCRRWQATAAHVLSMHQGGREGPLYAAHNEGRQPPIIPCKDTDPSATHHRAALIEREKETCIASCAEAPQRPPFAPLKRSMELPTDERALAAFPGIKPSADHCVSMLKEMSSAFTECVRAPTEMYVTPVEAIWRTVCRFTLPEPSVSTRPPM